MSILKFCSKRKLLNVSHRLERLCEKSREHLHKLGTRVEIRGVEMYLYNAGIKGKKVRYGLFARDLLFVSIMLRDPELLRNTIEFALLTQGKKQDATTGEEPYRVIHEFADREIRGLKTRYNACDVNSLLLIGLNHYFREIGDKNFFKEREDKIRDTVSYILSHIENGVFWEDPNFCGAKRYSLKATYWKDSGLPGREDPHYPVAYTLVQAQTVAALRSAAKLAEKFEIGYTPKELKEKADKLRKSVSNKFWDLKLDYPYIGLDQKGAIPGISSDGLHMLAYLQKGDIPRKNLNKIYENAKLLETSYGYRTYAPSQSEYSPESYHLGSIWPFEQFFIAKGAIIHGSEKILESSLGVIEALEKFGFHELFYWDRKKLIPSGERRPPIGSRLGGCDTHMPTVAYPLAILERLSQ